MKRILLSLALSSLVLGPALAATLSMSGVIKSIDAAKNDVVLQGGQTFVLPAKFDAKTIKVGENSSLTMSKEGDVVITGKRIRHRAIIVHLDHPRGYVRQDIIAKNEAIRAQTRAQRLVRTPHGIQEHGSE